MIPAVRIHDGTPPVSPNQTMMSPAPPKPIHLDYEGLRETQIADSSRAAEPAAIPVGADGPAGSDGKPHIQNTYHLLREIARGGMGVIYEARHRDLGRTVALKIMRGAHFADAEELGRFRAETEAVARLDHPNIIPIYEVGELQGQPFFTMKLVEGDSLADRVGFGPMPPRQAAQLMVKVARAVQHAHERGVLHRDLKPANILLDAQDEPYLTDFGIAKFAGTDSGLTMTGHVVGTTEYLSPEQAHGGKGLTTACDVWALGILLYQMLSGRLPFTGESGLQIMQRIMNDEAPPLTGTSPSPAAGGVPAPIPVTRPTGSRPALDRDLVTIVARCMEKELARRMPSAGFLADELERWLAGEPIRSRHVTQAERVWKWMRRYPYRVATIVAVLILFLAGSITSFVLWRQARRANVSLTQTNDQLAKSLRLSTATRLASESRVQLSEDGMLGLLLAIESAEITRGFDGTILPDSASALMNAMQRVGGTDATASRGEPPEPPDYKLFTRNSTYMRPSPDGRWFLTVDFAERGVFAALYEGGLPLREEPRRRWLLYDHTRPDVSFFEVRWHGDSTRIYTAQRQSRELIEWDVLAGLDPNDHAPTLTEPPPKRSLGALTEAENPVNVTVVPSRNGEPIGVLYTDEVPKGTFTIRWRPLHPAAGENRMEPPQEIRNCGGGQRREAHLSPSGRWLLAKDHILRVTPLLIKFGDGASFPEVFELPEPKMQVDSVAFSPDDRWMAFGRRDGSVRLYDLAAGTMSAILASGREVCRRSASTHGLAFSPDGRWLGISGGDSTVQVASLDPKSGVPALQHLRITGRGALTLAMSPDNQWLAAGSEDRVVSVWRLADIGSAGRPLEYRGLGDPVTGVMFSPDGRILAATSEDGVCRRWEFNGQSPGVVPAMTASDGNSIQTLATSPDGRWIATAGYPDSILQSTQRTTAKLRLFDTAHELREYSLPGHVCPTGVTISPDGRWLASTGKDAEVHVWSLPALTSALEAGRSIPEPLVLTGSETRLEYERRVTFHPKGRIYCTCGDGILFEWDLTAPNPAESLREHAIHTILYILTDVAVSPDGHWLAVGRHGYDADPKPGSKQRGNMLLLFDVSNPDKLVPRGEFPSRFRERGTVAFSPDNRWLAAGGQDGPAMVWDLTAADIGSSVRVSPIAAPLLTGVAFSPVTSSSDGPWLALGASDSRLYFWDWSGGPVALRRTEAGDPIYSAAYLPDGRLVTGGRDARLRIWETDPARLIEVARKTAGRKLTAKERARFEGK
jgi:serine/threonine protein kinase/WD40 repeat protein